MYSSPELVVGTPIVRPLRDPNEMQDAHLLRA
jgi:hypothetical protein